MDQIADRLAIFMKKEAISASALAELLAIQASGISHILSGRNKPGLEFITRFLNAFPKISPDWFILGKGDMYRLSGTGSEMEPELFTATEQPVKSSTTQAGDSDESKRVVDNQSASILRAPGREKLQKSPVKIIVLYSDGTFEAFANCESADSRR